ncbi:MAG: hypothetical protein GX654_13170 [Desulfatiglans sp.]|jgi:flagellar hook-basal body complex protein FliE|nr:hypothetical protein [Desulfatiglans sp.]
MDNFKEQELHEALNPITSLISKSEKSQQKLAPGTWQHKMLGDNIRALQYAASLISGDTDIKGSLTQDELHEALRSIASMINKAEKYQEKFLSGTSQHTLQKNRINALYIAERLIMIRIGWR